MCLNHYELADFPITNIDNFLPSVLGAAIPVNQTFLHFSHEQHLRGKCKNFDGRASYNRPNSFALKTF